MVEKKNTRLQVIPQQSTQNTANFPLPTYGENRWTFFIVQHGRDFILLNNFANSGSFAKVSVPVHIYNFLIDIRCLPTLDQSDAVETFTSKEQIISPKLV